MTNDGREQNEDPFPNDEEAFQEFIDGPRDAFVCDSCGSEAYRGHRGGEPGAFYAEVDTEPAIVCHDCDDAYDWETIESRVRSRRDLEQRSLLSGWIDRIGAVGVYILRRVALFGSRWHQRIPWSLTGSSNRRDSSRSEKPVDQPNEPQTGGPLQEEGQGPLDEAEELKQIREWATYLESELHDREERIQHLEAKQAGARQELEEAREDGQSKWPPTIEGGEVLIDLFDIRDNFRRLLEAESVLDDEVGAEFIEGIELIDNQIQAIFEREGVEVIDTSGEVDPTKHRVVSTIPTSEADPGDIVDVYLLGYRLDDYVLREAHVAVAEEPLVDGGSDPSDDDGRVNRGGDAK